jgi:hypothetical protein
MEFQALIGILKLIMRISSIAERKSEEWPRCGTQGGTSWTKF